MGKLNIKFTPNGPDNWAHDRFMEIRPTFMYIVELFSECWLAPWSGDPGRTTVLNNARTYKTKRGAQIALGLARKYRHFLKAKIVPVSVKHKRIKNIK